VLFRSRDSMGGGRSAIDHLRVPHAVFPWFVVPVGSELTQPSPEEVVQQHGVQEKVFAAYLHAAIQGEQAVKSLPWAILSVVLLALVILSHDATDDIQSLQASVDHDIFHGARFAFNGNFGKKNYQDVNSNADFWSWMNLGFMPLTNIHAKLVTEGSTLDIGNNSWDETLKYLKQNHRIGPIKLAQELALDVECPNPSVSHSLDIKCTRERNVNMNIQPTVFRQAQSSFHEDVNQTVWLNGFRDDNRQKLRDLETARWLNPKTNRVRVSALMFNPDSDVLMLVNINFLFARSGRIWKILTHRTTKLNLYQDWMVYLFDFMFYCQVGVLFVCEVKEMTMSIQTHGSGRRGMKEYMSLWNFIDWAFILVSIMLGVLWAVRVSTTNEVQKWLLELPPEASTCATDCASYYAGLFDEVEATGFYIDTVRRIGGFCPMVIMCRLFKAFAAQPRLALVTASLSKALPDLVHFMIVFMSVFWTYSVMCTALFGRDVVAFSTMDRSVPTLFRMLLRDFDYKEMEQVGRMFTFVVFVSFMWLMELVMLSMLIAIIMDYYAQVKARTFKGETVWSEVYELSLHAYQNWRGQRLPLPKIAAKFDDQADGVLFPKDIRERVPGLSEAQAEGLMRESVEEWSVNNSKNPTTDAVGNLLTEINVSLGDLPTELEDSPQLTIAAPWLAAEEAEVLRRSAEPTATRYSVEELAENFPVDMLLEVAMEKLRFGTHDCRFGVNIAMREIVVSALDVSRDLTHCRSVLSSCPLARGDYVCRAPMMRTV